MSKTIAIISLMIISVNAFSAELVCEKEEACKVTFATLAEARKVCFYSYMEEQKVVQIEEDGSKTTLGYVCVSKHLN